MKIKAILAAAVSAVLLAGCSSGAKELPSSTADSDISSSVVEKTELSFGTGLEEISITAKEDPRHQQANRAPQNSRSANPRR